MRYITYLLGLGVFVWAVSLAAGDLGMLKIWDTVSFIIVIVSSYLLLVSATGTFTFYKNKDHLKLWGDWAFNFGLLGTIIGWIFISAGMVIPLPPGVELQAALGASFAVSMITLFYGMFFKYFIVAYWLECCKK